MYLPAEQNLQFIDACFGIAKTFCESIPADSTILRKCELLLEITRRNSDFYVKCLSTLFETLLDTSHNLNAENEATDVQLISVYFTMIPYLKHFTFFPLLMKTVFASSLTLCNRHIRGFYRQPYFALNDFFSFVISSLERFEWEFHE